ncbi:MAG: glycosyltransferase [Salegentibacter mishustinae]|nr:glycosyltransferase [Salegentibacter mishustinae]
MKVLFLIDTLKGYGAETSLVEITTRFEKIAPIFVQIYKGDQLKKQLEESGIKVYSLNLAGKYNFVTAEKLILAIIEKEKPEIIHSTLFRADILARKIKKKLPHIILVGSLVNNSYSAYRCKEMNLKQKFKHFIVKEWDKITSKKVDYFISNSEAIVESNIQALKLKREKIKVIYRGRNPLIFSEKKTNRTQLPFIKNNSLVFLNISRLENRKGQKDLIKAFNLFKKSQPDALLILVGEGHQRKELEGFVNRLDLQQSVHFLGYRKDIPELLAISDFFVFPTYYEGLPGALIEAVFSKTPIIASNIPENKECLAPDSALLFNPGNIHDISICLNKALIISDWDRKTKLAYNYAKERFDIRNISKQYENFYIRINPEIKSSSKT